MKPIKNRHHCSASGRVKMLFETQKKAEAFMRFNNESIESISGFAPTRTYYCPNCGGWHLTSKINLFKTEKKSIKLNSL